MQCWNCGAPTRPGASICVYCGAQLAGQAGDARSDDRRRRPSSPPNRGRPDAYDAPDGDTGGDWGDPHAAQRPARRSPDEDGRGRRSSAGPPRRGRAPANLPPIPDGTDESAAYPRAGYPAVGDSVEMDAARGRQPRRDAPPERPNGPNGRDGRSGQDPLDDPRAPRALRSRGGGDRRRDERPPRSGGYDESGVYDEGYGQRRQGGRSVPPQGGRSVPPQDWGEPASRGGRSGGAGRSGWGDDSPDAAWAAPRDPRDPRSRGRDGRGDYDDQGNYSDERPARGGRSVPGRDARGGGRSLPPEDSYEMPRARGGYANETDERAAYGAYNQYDDYDAPPARGDRRGGRGERLPVPAGDRRMARPGGRGRPAGGMTDASVEVPTLRRKRGGRRLLLVLLVLIALVLTVVGGYVVAWPKVRGRLGFDAGSGTSTCAPAVSASSAQTPPAAPDAAPNTKLYTGQQARFSANIPTSWSGTSSADTTGGQLDYINTFAPGEGNYPRITLEQAAIFACRADADVIADEVAASVQQDGAAFTEVKNGPTTVAAGGETWARREYAVKAKDGTTLHEVILSCHHQGRSYVIVLLSAEKDFVTDVNTYLSPMLQSFTFL